MNRGYNDHGGVEPYNDGWGYTAHSGTNYSDHVCRPVVVDTDGRKQPIIHYASGAEGYVMKAEKRIIEVRYSPDEPLADRGRYGQLSPVINRPEKVEHFLTKVQDEASRPLTKVPGPFISSNWHARPNSAGKDYGTGTKNYVDDSNDFRDKQGDPKFYEGTNPNNKGVYPSSNYGPANDTGTAVDFLANAIKPNYGTNTKTDVSRPNKTGPLSSTHWRTGLNSAAQGRKVDADEDEKRMYGRDQIPNSREPTKQTNNKEGYGWANDNEPPMYFGRNPAPLQATSQQPRFPATTTLNRELYSAPEKIDSSEARKRYGNLKNQPIPDDAYAEKIDSNAAVKKYNGAKVPW